MSNRHSYENEAIEQVRSYLQAMRGIEYQITGQHVPVGNKNCDYLLASTDGSTTIAVEIVRLVDDPKSMEQHRWRSVLWNALKTECSKREISGFVVRTPWKLETPPREITQRLAPKVADGVAEILRDNPHASDFTVDGVHFRRTPWMEGIGPYANDGAHWVDMAGGAASILETLEDKDAQLALPTTERFLVAVPTGTELNANEIVRELAVREDLDRLRHADLVLHVPKHDKVSVAYARAVRDYFAGRIPIPDAHAALVDVWFCSRLGNHHEGTFELVKALRASRGSLSSLSVQARETLGHHGTKLIERGRYGDAAWIVRELHADPHPSAEESISEHAITTVRGTVAWLLHEVATHAPVGDLPEYLEITRSLSTDINQGVRRLAAYPLQVLMNWRDSFRQKRPLLAEEFRSGIKRVWLDYIDRAGASGLTDAARHTLAEVRDLTEAETEHVLEALQHGCDRETDQVFARFLVYFGFLRSSDPGMPRSFDDANLRERLKKLLHENVDLCTSVAFVFRNSTEEHPEIRRVLEPLLVMLLNASSEYRALRFTLDGAAHLARDGLLSSDGKAKLLRAINAAGPFKSYEAHFVASGIRKLASALDTQCNSINSASLINAIRDQEMRMAIDHQAETEDD